MKDYEELFEIAKRLNEASASGDAQEIAQPLGALKTSADKLKRSFSGSWLGYQSRVYYEGFAPPPPDDHFSQEWGLTHMEGSSGWREYDFEDVKSVIYKDANNPKIQPAREAANKANAIFDREKSNIISILQNELADETDAFLTKLIGELEHIEPLSKSNVAERWSPKGSFVVRDMTALNEKNQIPPHIDVLANVASIRHSFGICKAAAEICVKAASHLERKGRKKKAASRVGTNVFIGHGRSSAWRELKDFIQDRLALPWDEFNRVPVAGVTNVARLSEMLDAAAIAFLVMTAEDEMADGELQARMNVVHEAGLFQGRLGFTRAIVVLEDGCTEFSNIQGLGQIRFPKGRISAAFEEIRKVLEREGLIDEGT
jgi:predicted nucleotide-binding protein